MARIPTLPMHNDLTRMSRLAAASTRTVGWSCSPLAATCGCASPTPLCCHAPSCSNTAFLQAELHSGCYRDAIGSAVMIAAGWCIVPDKLISAATATPSSRAPMSPRPHLHQPFKQYLPSPPITCSTSTVQL